MAVAAVAQGAAKIGRGTVKAGAAVARVGARTASSAGKASQAKRTEEFRKSNKLARSMQRGQQSNPNQNRQARNAPAMRSVRPNPMPNIPNIPSPTGTGAPTDQANPQKQTAANDNVESENTEEESAAAQNININQVIQQARIQGALAESMGVKRQAWGDQPQAKAEADAAKELAKKAVPRGAAFMGNGIANVLDLSTGGLAIIIDIFIYMFSLGYLNYEMFTGKLSWDPLPMPIDKDADLLKGIIVITDILVVIVLLVFFTLQVIVIMVMFSPALIIGWLGVQGALSLLNFFS